MKIVFYNRTLISGGIEKCIENLSKYFYKEHELEVVYTDTDILDPSIVELLSRYAKVYKIEEGMHIDCDVCVWSFFYFDYPKLKNIIHAKKYIGWLHSMPRILPDCMLDNEDFMNDCSEIVCVSEAVRNHLNTTKEGIVIHNFMNPDIHELASISNPYENNDVMKLVVVCRLSGEKGFDRLLELVEKLKEKVPFNLKIVGKGRKKEPIIREMFSHLDEVDFVGYQENPYNYIKNADYLIQLSNDESWCNSITEAKMLGVPVVVRNFESAKEQVIDNHNGIIVPLENPDYDEITDRMIKLQRTLKENLKSFKYENEVDEWNKQFGIMEKVK